MLENSYFLVKNPEECISLQGTWLRQWLKQRQLFPSGSCQICTSVQNCTKTLLHEDTFARIDFFIVFFTITVTPNPYPRSVAFFFN